MELARRTVIAAGLGVLLGGCADGAGPTPPGPGATTNQSSGRPSPSPTLTATPVQRWQPSPGDREPHCKLAAVRAVERAGAERGRPVRIIDAQYGGLLSDAASVLVVTDGGTDDVRLTRHGSMWRVDAIHPSLPGSPGRISATARRVLVSTRIALPPAARADVQSGLVHDTVLAAMLALARDFRIGVSVVRSGHPRYVFGTRRLSDHPQGRAFDTWEVDGHAVVDPRTSHALVAEFMHAVAAAGSYNVGGPYLLGSAPQWFSDNTHHDHVHAGFLT